MLFKINIKYALCSEIPTQFPKPYIDSSDRYANAVVSRSANVFVDLNPLLGEKFGVIVFGF